MQVVDVRLGGQVEPEPGGGGVPPVGAGHEPCDDPYDGGRTSRISPFPRFSDPSPRTVASCACLIVPGTAVPRTDPTTPGSTARVAQRPEDPQATRPVPRQQRTSAPRPDETRVMRAQPRPDLERRASARPTPPPRPRRSSRRPAIGSATGGQDRKRRRFRARYLFVLLLLWLAYLVVVPIMAWHDVDKVAWEPDGDRPADQPGTTYLMVGQRLPGGPDRRRSARRSSTGKAAGGRTDTIMLLHTGSGPNLLLSIPRDSIVDIPGHPSGKINAAYAIGRPQLLVQTIEQNTGVRIDDYVEIGMGGVAGVVDAVGGIEVCPKTNMKRQARRARHQEGLPGGRRHDGAGVRAVPAHAQTSATSTGSATSARWSRRSAQGALAVDGDQPGPVLEAQQRDPRLLHVRRGHGTDASAACGRRR